MDKMPILIDTDPGVDDSLAILMAASRNDVDLRALTTVSGNVDADKTLRNALFLKQRYHLTCEVAAGAKKPLVKAVSERSEIVHGEDGLGGYPLPNVVERPVGKPAWNVICEQAARAGGRLRIIAIAPLTNIALALREHPGLPSKTDGITIMGGGEFSKGGRLEFNILSDPEAAQAVFSAFTVHVVDLEACFKARMTRNELDGMIRASGDDNFLASLFRHMREGWLERGMMTNTPFDPLTVFAALEASAVTWRRRHVRVDADPESPRYGRMLISSDPKEGNLAYVADGVDRALFMRRMEEAVRVMGRWSA